METLALLALASWDVLLALAPLLAGLTAAVSARLAVASDLRGRW